MDAPGMAERDDHSPIEATWQLADDAAALADAVADALEGAIRDGVRERGHAFLALAGGSTPGPAYELLDRTSLPWRAVSLIATDERWVPSDHELSNERMFRASLPQAMADGASVISLAASDENADPEASMGLLEERISALPDLLDVTLLGVGNDGHTASLFPDDPGLDDLFATSESIGIARPASQPTARISLSARRLLATRSVILAIRGEDKRAVLEASRRPTGCSPGSASAASSDAPITIFWSP